MSGFSSRVIERVAVSMHRLSQTINSGSKFRVSGNVEEGAREQGRTEQREASSWNENFYIWKIEDLVITKEHN